MKLDETRYAVIAEALGQMNHLDPSEWNEDGTPKVSVVRGYAKDQTITAEEITEADPAFRYQPPTPAEIAAAQANALADADGEDATDAQTEDEKNGVTERADGNSCIDFSKVAPERLPELESYKLEVEKLLTAETMLRDGAIRRIAQLNFELDKLISAIAVLKRPVAHTTEVRRYLERQQVERERSSRNLSQIGEALGLKLADHATPLDAAMKNGYSPMGGTKRRSMIPTAQGGVLDLGPIAMKVGPGQQV